MYRRIKKDTKNRILIFYCCLKNLHFLHFLSDMKHFASGSYVFLPQHVSLSSNRLYLKQLGFSSSQNLSRFTPASSQILRYSFLDSSMTILNVIFWNGSLILNDIGSSLLSSSFPQYLSFSPQCCICSGSSSFLQPQINASSSTFFGSITSATEGAFPENVHFMSDLFCTNCNQICNQLLYCRCTIWKKSVCGRGRIILL